VEVYLADNQSALKINPIRVINLAAEVVRHEKMSFDEVTIHFVGTDEICALHQQYFNDPSPTDCISFPLDDSDTEGYRVLGDVFVCPQTAIDYAKAHTIDSYQELTLYIVHGLLHLMGYDDIDEADRSNMRSAEEKHMNHLKKKGLLLKDEE
jgi:probable rRNA maturation factor